MNMIMHLKLHTLGTYLTLLPKVLYPYTQDDRQGTLAMDLIGHSLVTCHLSPRTHNLLALAL